MVLPMLRLPIVRRSGESPTPSDCGADGPVLCCSSSDMPPSDRGGGCSIAVRNTFVDVSPPLGDEQS
eukprot:5728453-Pyramimonas_sp.AAC.1